MAVFSKWQICNSWYETKISQNKGMPRESDIRSFSMLPSPCKSLAQWRIHGTHPTTSPVIQETKTSWWCHNQQVLKERQHWDNNLGSDYPDQSRTSDNMMLLTLSLSVIINNNIEICITTREPDKYTEDQNINQTKIAGYSTWQYSGPRK